MRRCQDPNKKQRAQSLAGVPPTGAALSPLASVPVTATAPARTPNCPFCKGVITPELSRAGGNCPHCMLEVPGEEAATDPGLEQRRRQAAESAVVAKRAGTRTRGVAAAVFLVVLVGAGAGWSAWRTQQEELVYELEDVYMAPRDGMIAHKEVAPSTPPPVETTRTPAQRKQRLPNLPTGGGEHVATAAEGGSGGPVGVKFIPAGSGGSGDIALGITSAKVGGSALGEVEIAVTRVNTTVLQTEDEIKAMAKEVSSAYYPQVEACVQRRLKADPEFKGGWKVRFTIETDGTVSGFKSTALDTPDDELEGCIERTISAWRFQRIAHPFKVGKTYRFAAGW